MYTRHLFKRNITFIATEQTKCFNNYDHGLVAKVDNLLTCLKMICLYPDTLIIGQIVVNMLMHVGYVKKHSQKNCKISWHVMCFDQKD